MGETTRIAWTDHTLNPWTRCRKVSPGCDNCYAETWAKRAKRPQDRDHKLLPVWGPEAPRTETREWLSNLRKWDRAAGESGRRARVFCASLADVFEAHDELIVLRARVLDALAEVQHLDVQLLTKRPQNVLEMVPRAWREAWPEHVWLGTTVEDEQRAYARIPYLLRVPAPVRFLSIEPMLEAIDLEPYMPAWICDSCGLFMRAEAQRRDFQSDPICAFCASLRVRIEEVSWVIVGGESGSHARPFDPKWAATLRDQCRDWAVDFFMKQYGSHPVLRDRFDISDERFGWLDRSGWDEHHGPPTLADGHGADPREWPPEFRVQEFPR